jgi:hypothetical protein
MGICFPLALMMLAVALANTRPEYVATDPAPGILLAYAGDPLGGLIEGGDPPIVIDGENAFVDGIENRIAVGCSHHSKRNPYYCKLQGTWGINRAFRIVLEARCC